MIKAVAVLFRKKEPRCDAVSCDIAAARARNTEAFEAFQQAVNEVFSPLHLVGGVPSYAAKRDKRHNA